jgi:hypothetical protein
LFVSDEDVVEFAVLQSVVSGQNGSAGIAEDGFDAFAFDTFPEDLSAGFDGCVGHKLGNKPTDRSVVILLC